MIPVSRLGLDGWRPEGDGGEGVSDEDKERWVDLNRGETDGGGGEVESCVILRTKEKKVSGEE